MQRGGQAAAEDARWDGLALLAISSACWGQGFRALADAAAKGRPGRFDPMQVAVNSHCWRLGGMLLTNFLTESWTGKLQWVSMAMRLQRNSWRSPKKCIIQQVEEGGDEQALSYCHAFVQGLSKQHSLQCWVDEWPIKSLSGILHCRAFLQGLTEQRSLQRRWTHPLTSLCHWPVWDSAMLILCAGTLRAAWPPPAVRQRPRRPWLQMSAHPPGLAPTGTGYTLRSHRQAVAAPLCMAAIASISRAGISRPLCRPLTAGSLHLHNV